MSRVFRIPAEARRCGAARGGTENGWGEAWGVRGAVAVVLCHVLPRGKRVVGTRHHACSMTHLLLWLSPIKMACSKAQRRVFTLISPATWKKKPLTTRLMYTTRLRDKQVGTKCFAYICIQNSNPALQKMKLCQKNMCSAPSSDSNDPSYT